MTRLLLTGAGAVTWCGNGLAPLRDAVSGNGEFATEELSGQTFAVGRVGRLEHKESAASYKRWGQLDTYSRYGFVAASQALADAGVGDDAPGRERMGVLLGTAFGCIEENQRFDRYSVTEQGQLKGASPLLFKGTVDNAPAGWIAVAWKLRGPNATFVSGDGAALEALWSAEGLLRAGRAPALLVGGVERFVALHTLLRDRDPERQGEVLSEGAGVALVEREDSAARRGVRGRAELLGVARTLGSLDHARAAALESLDVDPAEVGLSLDATPAGIKRHLGEPHGAWGGLALCAALAILESDGWGGKSHAIVHAFGEGDEHFFAVLKTLEEQT